MTYFKRMKKFLLLIYFSFITGIAFSQKIVGKVSNKSSIPLEFANVYILNTDSTFNEGCVTDANGMFVLANGLPSECIMKVSLVGYKTIYIHPDSENIKNIILPESEFTLNEVVVKSKIPKFKIVPGGYTTKIKNSFFENLNNVDEIISSLPKITGSNGNYTIFGKGSPVIYINGRKIVSNSELEALNLKEIESITVLSNPGEKYDSETKSVIVIKTKRGSGYGLSGNLLSSFYQNYKSGYNINLNMNWKSKKYDIFGGINNSNLYDYSKKESEHTIRGNNNIIEEKISNLYSRSRLKQISGKIGFDYILNDSNSIGFQYRLYKDVKHQYMYTNYEDHISVSRADEENLLYHISSLPNNGPTHIIDVYYSGNIMNYNLSFDGTYIKKKTFGTFSTEEVSNNIKDNINSIKASSSRTYAAKMVIEKNVNEDVSVSVGGEYYNSSINQSYINKEGIIANSDNYILEKNIACFSSFDYSFGSFDLSAGLRYEKINNSFLTNKIKNNETSKSYNRLFPNLNLTYQWDQFNIGLSYDVTSTRPTYAQLSSTVAYDSKYLYEGGNPNLKSSLEHCLELSAAYKIFSLSLSYEYDKNPIIKWGNLYNSTSDIIKLTNINIPTQKYLIFSLTASPVFSIWHGLVEVDYQKQYLDNLELNYNFNKGFWQFVLKNKFVFKKDYMIEANYLFRTSGADGYVFTNRYHSFDLAISKSFIKNKLYLKAQIEDVFLSSKSINEMVTNNYKVKQTIYPLYRNYMLTIGYRFNQSRKRYAGEGAGLEERKRL